MFDATDISSQVTHAELPAALPPNGLAKLIADAMDAMQRDQESARALLRRAMAMLQTGGAKSPAGAPTPARPSLAPWQAKRVADHIRAQLHRSLTLHELAGVARLSNSHFSRAFKGAFGQTPHAFIMGQRVELARQKMLDSHAPLSQIALSCGFADQAHFARLFRRKTGFAPHQWRRANQSSPQ